MQASHREFASQNLPQVGGRTMRGRTGGCAGAHPDRDRSVRAFGSETADVVDDVPGVLFRHAALVALHEELRTRALADDGEDFTVGRSSRPLGVGEIGRMTIFWLHGAVALGIGT